MEPSRTFSTEAGTDLRLLSLSMPNCFWPLQWFFLSNYAVPSAGARSFLSKFKLILGCVLSPDATSSCCFSFFFELRKRPPHPLALLNACKCRDSCRYGCQRSLKPSHKIWQWKNLGQIGKHLKPGEPAVIKQTSWHADKIILKQ